MAIEISTIMPLNLSKFSMMESAVEIVNRPQRSGDLFDGIGPLAGSGFRGQEKIGGLRIADARGFERDDNLAVSPFSPKKPPLAGAKMPKTVNSPPSRKMVRPMPSPAGNKASPSAEPIMQTRCPRISSSRVKILPA
jgi:hypothetical protein